MSYRAITLPASILIHPLRQFPTHQQAIAVVCQKDVPRTYITIQDLRGIVCMGVSFGELYHVNVKGRVSLEVNAPRRASKTAVTSTLVHLTLQSARPTTP